MSKLEELIQQYCPDGVEWKTLGEATLMKRGTSATKGVMQEGSIPVISGGRQPAFYCNQSNRTGETITVAGSGAGAGYVQYWNEPIFVCDAFSVQGNENLNTKFIYYFMTSIQEKIYATKKGGGVPHVHISSIDKFEIPVPPLPVQEEIVRILDTFTELQTELQAELQKRLQQYNYYKWSLLESLSCPTKHITDIALVKARVGWQRLTTAEYQATGDYYLITGTDFKNGQIDFDSCVYVSKERYEMDPNIIVGKGDILITKDGTLGKVAILNNEPDKPTTLNSGVFRIHITDDQVSPRYLFHYFTSNYFTDFVESVKTGSTIPHLTQQGLVSLNIPIPSLEEQNRVVAILDRFDSLTNDLTAGLPAEIEKRKQQYEYYRDRLLTFKRINYV